MNWCSGAGSLGLGPVGQGRPQVHERVADRGHLPVEDGDDPGQVAGVEDEVVKLEVVVDQGRRGRLGRPVRGQPGRGPFQVGDVVGAGVLVALDPAGHLALDVALGLAEVVQPGGAVIERVQQGHVVDERLAEPPHQLGRNRPIGRRRAAEDDPVAAAPSGKTGLRGRSHPRSRGREPARAR